ncbi:MAG: sulfur oxidation c-type cytochrome SoxX [Pseudomonadota bacterium]
MKQILALAAVGAFAAPLAWAEVVAPSDVVFVEGAVETSLSGTPGDPDRGAVLMNKGAGNCIACHAVEALAELPFHGEVGPPLDGAADRWSTAELRGIVANAKVMFEGSMMPSFYRTEGFFRLGDAYTGKAATGEAQPLLTAQEVEDVVSFLQTLTFE